jgi:hypothetical protein
MKTRFRELRRSRKQEPVVIPTKEMVSADQLVRQFPIGSLVYVTICCDMPDKKYPERGILKDQDVVRITGKGWELLASNRGDWVEKYNKEPIYGTNQMRTREEYVEATYMETTFIYEKESNGCITARVFYKEDKKLLRKWEFVSDKLKEIIKAASKQGA